MMPKPRPVLMLILLLLTSMAPALVSSVEVEQISLDSIGLLDQPMTDDERLLMAKQMWHQAEPTQIVETGISPSSGLISIAAGTFDPLLSAGPQFENGMMRSNDVLFTGLLIVQLNEFNGLHIETLSEEYGLEVLDFVADEAFLVRVSEDSDLISLNADERVRWIGTSHPAWRVSPYIQDNIESYNNFAIVPASDLEVGGYERLALDIAGYGADEVWCGIGLCEVFVSSNQQQVISALAHDGRVIWVEPTYGLELHNVVAAAISGVTYTNNNAGFTLDGSGEMIAIADTGLDRDHPDLTGRVAAVYTQFGLDPSPADTNTGHGTHIALTAAGDGTGDSSATGIAPDANIVFYALEHDATGVFGRQGSIYDLLRDAEQMTARIAINAWGLNGNYGQYTADSRSVDIFVHDKPDVLPVFSVGDNGANGASQVTAPATAKNVLAVGASTTGSGGTTAAGSVANFSSIGPSLDGRIKPDVVAPGVEVCSGRAEEAKYPAGSSCASGTHANGDDYYMTLSGSSQATAVAGGVAALTREFIREQIGINAPSNALVKAAVINGAQDLGTADIPNAEEGWGQVDLNRTVLPMDGSFALDTYYDDNRPLQAGFSLIYSFTMDSMHGVDLTLAWSDEAGSANAAQGDARLVNDLDLTLIAPDGTEYKGNNFANGFSQSGGSYDSLNNVERIKIAPSSTSNSGQWLVKVSHNGGTVQSFGLVMSAEATLDPKADLATFDGSILTSSEFPLANDLVSIRLAWINQGTKDASSFSIKLEDLTEATVLYEGNQDALASGALNSISIWHQFSTTGTHQLKLSIDTNDQVDEMNDGTAGVDNNIWIQDVDVRALGVRVVAFNDDGSVPVSSEDRADAAVKDFDVRNETGIDIPMRILHEGTGNQTVSLTVTAVQVPHETRPDFLLPTEDTWTKSLSFAGSFTLTGQGTVGDYKDVTLHLEDEDADLEDADNPRYARAGTYVVDVTAQYQNQPTVAHTQRMTVIVEQVDDVKIVASGTNGLAAVPGDSASFAIAVMNTGNAPAQYNLECFSSNNWQLMLGNSNSSSLDFEPLNIREGLPMGVRIIVPPVVEGSPQAGQIDSVTCYVTSSTDPTLNHSETVSIEVLEFIDFEVDLYDDLGPIGPAALARDVAADSGERVSLNLSVENTGNTDISVEVSIQPSKSWAIEATYGEQSDSRKVSLTLTPGQVATVNFLIGVPVTAAKGDFNSFDIRTERTAQSFIANTTTITVRDELAIDLEASSDSVDVAISDLFSYAEFSVRNDGNAPLSLSWTHGLLPDGWTAGFANPTLWLEPREEKVVRLGIIPPLNEPTNPQALELLVTVTGENSGESVEDSVRIDIAIIESNYANVTVADDSVRPFNNIAREDTATQELVIRNDGNIPLNADLSFEMLDGEDELRNDWILSVEPSSISNLAVGESVTVTVTATSKDSTGKGIGYATLNLTADGEVVGQIAIETSVELKQGNSGLLSLPIYIWLPILIVLVAGAIVGARKMKASGELADIGEELVAPDAHTMPDHLGTRRDDALDIGHAVNDMTSGSVSEEELAAALAQSIDLPAMPPAGMPPAGMPPAGMPPAGLPPMGMPPAGLPPADGKALPVLPTPAAPLPAPMPAPMPAPLPAVQPVAPITPQAPPVPAEGLPAGWTMEQWTHYGHEWLARNGRA